ncbi:hypothetical protein SDSE159_14200 [Streptococcus dysgalactiae subsp. equisimilis]|uniref:Ribose transport system ATP-binding protein n=1 Tax=Streptococcus dysgalactiae TaxID=1334 RepID=A0ABU0AA14_STRDY|nr:ribose ABC transporter, ATP-binding protein RbsA family protein [Streptococcus dysgalactiae subsp. equisimilis SK1249]MDQ0264136.1 ribose transport system ATP-binding protein [Streptococcus dysgalactiae]OBZ02458.1 ribose ABC transporter ATP-binding protein [Streptococcus dysgalactiae subsp. equisimilis]BCK50163.1 hypothetical protein SDSE159_14200 [Streptococcus dysgalactiae subsp. equisimilis]GET73430.1 hypothetical protein KNZ04_19180 [Streptococcus dysgalactiae subsp. equisimilis]
MIDGKEMAFANPQEAEAFGISFIHQEMNTWPEMTVLENLFLGREIKKSFGLLDDKAMKEKARYAFKRLGVSIPLDKRIGDLSVGQQQMIEIAIQAAIDHYNGKKWIKRPYHQFTLLPKKMLTNTIGKLTITALKLRLKGFF